LQAHKRTELAEERASSAQSTVSHLQEELAKSESQLREMRQHVQQLLTLHEGLTEAAINLGASDESLLELISELDTKLSGSPVVGIADQLDELLQSGGKGGTPRALNLTFPGAGAAPGAGAKQMQRAVQKTRTNLMTARRYLLSTRQRSQQGASAGAAAPAALARGVSPLAPIGQEATQGTGGAQLQARLELNGTLELGGGSAGGGGGGGLAAPSPARRSSSGGENSILSLSGSAVPTPPSASRPIGSPTSRPGRTLTVSTDRASATSPTGAWSMSMSPSSPATTRSLNGAGGPGMGSPLTRRSNASRSMPVTQSLASNS
jgi:hypothetical protein